MKRVDRAAAGGLAALLIAVPAWLSFGGGPAAGQALAGVAEIRLQPLVWNLSSPLLVTSAPDGSDRLFIVEQGGLIKLLERGASTPTVFLDIRSEVLVGAQQGLLGLAFHPEYASNGRFFIDYTRRSDEATVIAEYRVSASDAAVANPAASVLLVIPQVLPSLAGGTLAFGSDGFLYIGVGNDGVDDDPTNTAQDLGKLLGKILRIDVDHPAGSLPYSSPTSNPFFGATPGRDEIFAYGLRNPWRFSFDRLTGDLLAGDVGNHLREEIDLITRGGNYGWRVREGTVCSNNDPDLCDAPGFTAPLIDYVHTPERCAVVGGHVYRGSRGSLPQGSYVFGDFCSGEIFLLQNGVMRVLLDTPLVISSFGEDRAGEVYVVDWLGAVYRITGAGGPADGGMVAAVLPGSRSVQVGAVATAFVTMIWTGPEAATGCGVAPLAGFRSGEFLYQSTDPRTNQLVGSPNTPVQLAPGASHTFLIAFTPSAPMRPREALLGFSCANAPAALVIPGVNTLLLSADSEPVADIVAMASTTGNDGIVTIGAGGLGAFAVATANVGAAATITASADTGDLPITASVCRTEPGTGACVMPPDQFVTVEIAAAATSTFSVFVASDVPITFDPAYHRVNVLFRDATGATRGLTSVAVRTSSPGAAASRSSGD